MCGRFVAATPPSTLAAHFRVDEIVEDAPASYNVAPTDPVPVVATSRDGTRRLGVMRWGLIPSWSKSAAGAAGRINARAETVLSKPSFRTAFSRHRCLVAADGFYEWQKSPGGPKQAWYIRRRDSTPMAMAGVWESWGDGDNRVRTCAVMTTAANALMAPVHDRMPVMVEAANWEAWLDPSNTDGDALAFLMVPAAEGLLERHAVGAAVGNVRNNGASLVEPLVGTTAHR